MTPLFLIERAGTSKQRRDRAFDGFGLCHRREARDHLAGAVDEEFGEIPLDAFAAEHAGFLVLEIFVERMRASAVDVDLGEHGKADAVIDLAELSDLRFAA